jgi:two-component system response regulator
MKLLPTRVLLVEDNPDDLELAQLAFERGRFANTVDVARDGAEALDHLFRTGRHADRDPADAPRLVLLDIKLPLVDGIDVLRAIKADARTKHVPVVMLTSSAEDRDLHACYELGANSYIVKPVDMEQFLQAVQNIGLYWLMLNQTDQLM